MSRPAPSRPLDARVGGPAESFVTPSPTPHSTQNEKWSMLVPKLRPGFPGLKERISASSSTAHQRFSKRTPRSAQAHDRWRAVRFILSFVGAVVVLSIWAIRYAPAAEPGAFFSAPAGSEWIRQSMLAPPRKNTLLFYRPSSGASDYLLKFDWKMQSPGISWVFRAADVRNYYAARVKATPEGFLAERFSVIGGIEGPHIKKLLNLPNGTPEVEIAFKALGPVFQLYLRNELVDLWRDERFKTGSVGFLEERNQKVPVKSIHYSPLGTPSTDLFRESFQYLTAIQTWIRTAPVTWRPPLYR